MKYLIVHRTQSGTRPALKPRPTIGVDVSSLVRGDEDEPVTEHRPDLARGLARIMGDYPEMK